MPVLAKFIGLKDLPKTQIHVSGSSSYLALTTLIGRTIETNFFAKSAGAVPLETLVKDLPQTHMVSENGQAAVLEYKGRDYLKLNRGSGSLMEDKADKGGLKGRPPLRSSRSACAKLLRKAFFYVRFQRSPIAPRAHFLSKSATSPKAF